jgi:sensor histidine kinase YesM
MLLTDVIAFQKRRIRNPWVWIPLVGLGTLIAVPGFFSLLRGLHSGQTASALIAILMAFGTTALYLWLCPAPWLWTGTRATHAPLLSGAFQALVFNVAYLLGLSILSSLLAWPTEPLPYLGMAIGLALSNVLIHAIAAALLGYFMLLWERTRIVKDETEKKLREAHWVLLRGQLSPHVLFNALNGLAELVRIDAVAAEQGILDLADLFRALLDHGSRPSTPLREEKRLVSRYLAVENVRLGSRLRVSWDWDASLEDFETPPFLVQPMVENAIKHGISPHPEGGEIAVSLRQDGSELVLGVRNSGQALGHSKSRDGGVGVGNLEARLYLAFGERAHFRLEPEGDHTAAEVRIPLDILRRQQP